MEARRLCLAVQFDLAHHVTFVNDWMFTFLALLRLLFVRVPGSHPAIPSQLSRDSRLLVIDRVRFTFQRLMRLVDPLFWLSLIRADLIIGINDDVFMRFPMRLVSHNEGWCTRP